MSVFCVIDQKMTLEDVTRKVHLAAPLAYDNSSAHSMRVTVFNQDGTEADLTGISAVGSFMRLTDTGGTVTPINGTVTGNVAEVILPGSCYVVPGRFRFTLNLSELTPTTGIDDFSTSESYSKGDLVVYSGAVWRFTTAHSAGAWTGTDAVLDGNMRTALWVEGVVERNISGTIIDPGTPVGNIEQAIGQATSAAQTAAAAATAANNAAEAASTAMNGAVRFDQAQAITDGGAIARGNIGAAMDTEIALDLSQPYAGYAAGDVGASISFGSSSKTTTYRKCVWVEAGASYTVRIVNGTEPASTSARTVKIAGEDNIITQNISMTVTAGETDTAHFTAVASGWAYIGIDANATGVSMTGGVVRDLSADIAPVEHGTASAAYGVGDLLMLNGQLYRVTVDITAGDTLTPGTNLAATRVSEKIEAEATALDGRLDILEAVGPVRYDTAQTLTDVQKGTARRNIGANDLTAAGYFSGMLGSTGTATFNAKKATANGNYAVIEGTTSSSGSYTTFSMFNIAGTFGGVSGSHSAANLKALYDAGYYAALPDGFLDPEATGLELTVAFEKTVVTQTPQDWSIGVFTYDPVGDAVTAGYYKTSLNTHGLGNSGIFRTQLKTVSGDFIAALRANKNLMIVLYARAATQYTGNVLKVRWDIRPLIPETPLRVPVSDATPTITAVNGSLYDCGTVTELTFTPSSTGICSVRFKAGSSMVLTLPNTVKMPDWWSASSIVQGRTYEISIADGVYGVVTSWA